MKLKEWMDFNEPFMKCDFKVRLLPYKRWDNPLSETIATWDVCYKIFGEYEMVRLGVDKYPKTEAGCFKLILWDHPKGGEEVVDS